MPSRGSLIGWTLASVTLALCLTGCVPQDSSTGNAAAGESKFNSSCAFCHSAASLRGAASRVVNDMGSLGIPAMAGITLTDEEVANIRAFLITQ